MRSVPVPGVWPSAPRLSFGPEYRDLAPPRDCCVLCGVCVVGRVGGPKKRKEGCRRLVAIHGRDGATAAPREWFRTQETMMTHMRHAHHMRDGDDCDIPNNKEESRAYE